jgi:hypothetical protein
MMTMMRMMTTMSLMETTLKAKVWPMDLFDALSLPSVSKLLSEY